MVKILLYVLYGLFYRKKKHCRNYWKPLPAEEHLVMDLVFKRFCSLSMEMEHVFLGAWCSTLDVITHRKQRPSHFRQAIFFYSVVSRRPLQIRCKQCNHSLWLWVSVILGQTILSILWLTLCFFSNLYLLNLFSQISVPTNVFISFRADCVDYKT